MPPVAGTRLAFDTAAAEWLRHVEHDRGRKPTTIRGYQSLLRTHLLPELGRLPLTDITAEHIERWVWNIDCSAATRAKIIVCPSGIYRRARRVWGITYNPVEDVERPQLRPTFEVNVYTELKGRRSADATRHREIIENPLQIARPDSEEAQTTEIVVSPVRVRVSPSRQACTTRERVVGGMTGALGHAAEFSSSAGTSGRSRAMKWPALRTSVNSAAGSKCLLACRSDGRDQSSSP
jgi:hypothetical protein